MIFYLNNMYNEIGKYNNFKIYYQYIFKVLKWKVQAMNA